MTSTAGMSALVYAFIHAASSGWTNRLTVVAFSVAVALLVAFVMNEARSPQPITPLRLFADRSRSASYVARLLLVAGMFGMFFFLTQYVQEILRFSPLRAGIAFVPMTGALFAVSRLAPRLIGRFGPKTPMVAGLVPVVGGMTWLTQISPGTTYVPGILGPMLLLGLGMGITFVPLTTASLAGVRPEDSGAASSMVNVTQQVGGALGLAILVTVFGTASKAAARQPLPGTDPIARAHQILTHAMASSFTTAAVFDLCALLIITFAIKMQVARPAVSAATVTTRD